MKYKMILLIVFGFILIPSLSIAGITYNSKEFKDVIKQLDMQGHADHDLSTCTVKKVYYDEVVEMLEQGKSGKEIIQFYVDEYGQAALRTPGNQGADLVAWAMPALGFLTGAIIVAVLIKKMITKKEAAGTGFSSIDYWSSSAEKEITEKTIEEERRKLF
ncbi:hypothetical protein CU633_00310 [Bacillus sp. V3-13]|uniref:cytochrome c-type biogenesis protein CcmH n=1 Tax=Bacillus sp. V3-13 TaxID=2053728 RepID=UPI000C761641|nr:cytochrome c-type biogenesis protein CcmH [Bacillus sp. V3-13]PLR79453.1 hypothetical protein CU633_00310 [Bacillus sp. V3-13]